MKVELDLPNYAMKGDLKGATGTDTSTLASKSDLASLKRKVDNLDVDKLKTAPANLSKLSNVVDNDVVKNTVYDTLVAKVSVVEIPSTNGLLTKTQCNSDKQGLEKKIKNADKKIPNTSGLVRMTDYNTKHTEHENKIPSITGLVANAALNTKATEIKNKIFDITNLTISCSEYNGYRD